MSSSIRAYSGCRLPGLGIECRVSVGLLEYFGGPQNPEPRPHMPGLKVLGLISWDVPPLYYQPLKGMIIRGGGGTIFPIQDC